MKSLIIYSSQSGNTQKLAQAVYDNIKGEKKITAVEQASPNCEGYDLVGVGFWLQAGKPDPKTLKFLDDFNGSGKVFFFATHGAAQDSDHAKNAMDHATGFLRDDQVAGTFSCQGEVNPKVLAKVRQKDTPPVWINDADDAVGHPDDGDIQKLVVMVKAIGM
ncbi:MAG: flavodoxin family protein [Desulfobacter sp.]|nr:flavodoxin family protein [Desulfobacter sp.]WDP85269.1 MAG: flavodoxin family protein [Desulfobacter sp.]